MEKYRTIKDLVLATIQKTDGRVDYETITELVKQHFPKSKWQKSHWAWYRSQIKAGKIRTALSEEKRQKLTASRAAKDNAKIKALGDVILNQVRKELTKAANGDVLLYFKLNRWIHSRLLQYEIQIKKPIKKALWDSGMRSCQRCKKEFTSIKGIEIHRKDSNLGYSKENCELLCKPCHESEKN